MPPAIKAELPKEVVDLFKTDAKGLYNQIGELPSE